MRAAMLMCAAALVLMGCETKQDTGTLMGAIAGGVIGNQFGKGGGRVASTFAGAVHCCESCRRKNSNALAETEPSEPTCASLPPQTGTWNVKWQTADFEWTSIIG